MCFKTTVMLLYVLKRGGICFPVHAAAPMQAFLDIPVLCNASQLLSGNSNLVRVPAAQAVPVSLCERCQRKMHSHQVNHCPGCACPSV